MVLTKDILQNFLAPAEFMKPGVRIVRVEGIRSDVSKQQIKELFEYTTEPLTHNWEYHDRYFTWSLPETERLNGYNTRVQGFLVVCHS
jgi:hypothetical protein